MRQIPLAQNVDENNVHACFEHGVLEIVASQAGAEPRRKDEGRYQVTAAGGRHLADLIGVAGRDFTCWFTLLAEQAGACGGR